MIVLVTGGTGVLGMPTIRRLTEAGHQVRGLAHRQRTVDELRAIEADSVPGDLVSGAGLQDAVAGVDAVLHLATHIPSVLRMGRVNAWTATDRIRRDGTRNLVDACLAAGVTTFVYPSIVLVYADAGDQWIDADCGVLDPPPHARSTLDAETEVHRISAAGGRGLSLRLGLLYSPHDEVTAMQLSMARRGIGSAVGPDEAYWPALWVEDAATAFVAALDAPAGVYDLVDDRPLTRAELHQAMAAAVGRRLWRLPRPLQPLLTGQLTASLSRSLRVSNRRFREVTGWRPSVPDAAAGWQRIVRPG